MTIVKARHLQMMKPIYCVNGAEKFFKRHGLDWRKFVMEGIDANELLATDDYMAIRLVEKAKDNPL